MIRHGFKKVESFAFSLLIRREDWTKLKVKIESENESNLENPKKISTLIEPDGITGRTIRENYCTCLTKIKKNSNKGKVIIIIAS